MDSAARIMGTHMLLQSTLGYIITVQYLINVHNVKNSLSYGLQRNDNLMLLNKQFKVLKLLKIGLEEIEKH